MRKYAVLCFAVLHFAIILAFDGCREKQEDILLIATAANVQFAMEELGQSFTDKTGIPCEIIIGSSGKLMAQIREGAPFHVFVSADMKYPAALYEDGLTTEAPVIYAQGALVLWSIGAGIPGIDALDDLNGKIAMANPLTAPYGRAAKEALEYYNLFDALEERLVYGESIAQTNQFIISGAAEAGFTAKSVVLSPEMKDRGEWREISDEAYSPIDQGIVVIRTGGDMEAKAEEFRKYLLSEEARRVFSEYGYKTIAKP